MAKPKKKTKKDAQDTVKSGLGEWFTTIAWALAIAFVMRTFFFQPFHIPSGSMEPNLQIGDYLITSKYSVGYGKYAADPLPFPINSGRLFERELNRGDIILFKPEDNDKTFIKRLVGLPGDSVQMRGGVLFINGTAVDMEKIGQEQRFHKSGVSETAEVWRETLPGGHEHKIYDVEKNNSADDTAVFNVPEGRYFLMGDNRDRSGDSRMYTFQGGAGIVPAENIIGRAEFVLLSVTEDFELFKPWTWGNMRGDRFFKGLR